MPRHVVMKFNSKSSHLLYVANEGSRSLRAVLSLLVKLKILDDEVTIVSESGQIASFKHVN